MQFSHLSKGSPASAPEPVTGSNPIMERPVSFCDGSCAGFPSVILRDVTCRSVHLSSPVCCMTLHLGVFLLCTVVVAQIHPPPSAAFIEINQTYNGNNTVVSSPYILITLMFFSIYTNAHYCLFRVYCNCLICFTVFCFYHDVPAYAVSGSDHRCVY